MKWINLGTDMGNFGLGLRVMWRIWQDSAFAEQVKQLESGAKIVREETPARPEPPPAPAREKKPARSEALALLAALQREARFVDFIKEPIASYSDAQIGAAVRDVHKNCGSVLDRMFALEPLLQAAEGAVMQVPRGFDPGQYRLVGNVGKEPPYQGTVAHPGWKAGRCELPEWTGSQSSAWVVAPAEVEIK
jgi:hypothetical protein